MQLILGEPGRQFSGSLKCVIVGTSKKLESDQDYIHYTIIVSPVAGGDAMEGYERVGVAVLERRHIMLDLRSTLARIQ